MEIPYTVSTRPDTGLWNAKIGIWLFLAHRCSSRDVATRPAQRSGRHDEYRDLDLVVRHGRARVGGAKDEKISRLLVVHAGHDFLWCDLSCRQTRLRMAAEVRAFRRLY